MTDLRVTTTQGADTVLKDTAIGAFNPSLRGELLRPSDPGYETVRTIWNALSGSTTCFSLTTGRGIGLPFQSGALQRSQARQFSGQITLPRRSWT